MDQGIATDAQRQQPDSAQTHGSRTPPGLPVDAGSAVRAFDMASRDGGVFDAGTSTDAAAPSNSDAGISVEDDDTDPQDGGTDDDAESLGSVLFEAKKTGRLIAVTEQGKLHVLDELTVRLVCRGEEPSQQNFNRRRCSSTLEVTRTKDGKTEQVAELSHDIPGIDYEAAGGNAEDLSLHLFPFLPEQNGMLIVVEHFSREGDENLSEEKTATLFAISENTLTDVLTYSAAQGESNESESKREDSATTLEIGKRHFGGVPILTAQTETTTYGRRGPKVSHSKKNYAWIAESQSFTACDKLIGNAHSSSCGRRCQSGEEFCFGQCRKYDTVQHCGACGTSCRVGQRCCNGHCAAPDDPRNCGACGNSCAPPDPAAAVGICTDATKKQCGLLCRSTHYDLDGDPKNGCERAVSESGHASEATAAMRPPRSCNDGDRDVFTGELASDARPRVDPIPGFVKEVGGAPKVYGIPTRGGWFCQNDYRFVITTSGGASGACYQITIKTNRSSQRMPVPGSGRVELVAHRGAYASGTPIYVTLEKTCPQSQVGLLTYSIDYHL